MKTSKIKRRERIKKRIRKLISGTAEHPRLSVYRSNKHFFGQVIDDLSGMTIAAASSLKNKETKTSSKTQQAKKVGKELGEQIFKKGILKVKFDRNGYLYHGRVKAFAEAVRESGIKF